MVLTKNEGAVLSALVLALVCLAIPGAILLYAVDGYWWRGDLGRVSAIARAIGVAVIFAGLFLAIRRVIANAKARADAFNASHRVYESNSADSGPDEGIRRPLVALLVLVMVIASLSYSFLELIGSGPQPPTDSSFPLGPFTLASVIAVLSLLALLFAWMLGRGIRNRFRR